MDANSFFTFKPSCASLLRKSLLNGCAPSQHQEVTTIQLSGGRDNATVVHSACPPLMLFPRHAPLDPAKDRVQDLTERWSNSGQLFLYSCLSVRKLVGFFFPPFYMSLSPRRKNNNLKGLGTFLKRKYIKYCRFSVT